MKISSVVDLLEGGYPGSKMELKDVLDALELAATDDRIKVIYLYYEVYRSSCGPQGVVASVESPGGLAISQEIGEAVKLFRHRTHDKKFSWAFGGIRR